MRHRLGCGLAGAILALAAADASATTWNPREAQCREQLQRSVGACASDAQRTAPSGDFGYWQRCRARYQPEYERCLQRAPAADQPPPGCEAAKTNIEWVLLRDTGARGSYDHARTTRAPLEAVIYAQRHNRDAQASIRRCGGWAGEYAALLEKSGRRPRPGAPAPAPPPPPSNDERNDANAANCLWVGETRDDYETMRDFYKGAPPQWSIRLPVSYQRCREPILLLVCVRQRGKPNQLYRRTYGAGYSAENPLNIIITNGKPSDVRIDPPIKCPLRQNCRSDC